MKQHNPAPAPYIQPDEIRARDYRPSYHPSYRPREDHYVPAVSSYREPPAHVPVTHFVQSPAKLDAARANGVASSAAMPKPARQRNLNPHGPVAKMLACLAAHPEGVTPAVLAAAGERKSRDIGPTLKNDIRAGRVRRDAESGLWMLVAKRWNDQQWKPG